MSPMVSSQRVIIRCPVGNTMPFTGPTTQSHARAAKDVARGARSYFGGPCAANADFTVFFETPSTRAIALIGNPSPTPTKHASGLLAGVPPHGCSQPVG